ncbi:Hsp70 family protein [Nocardia sp. NPDC049190]|uniref:Hsp70 family protein n=1 Tax=Nocardia sp. NPDC049190 TaxID=3155650 RepID=UPI0033CD0664
MTTGLGFSIGSVNSVTASVHGVRTRPVARSRRTAVTFDSAGGLRVGGISRLGMAITDFADLSRDPDTVVVGGRIWSPANLVAAVVQELRASEPAAIEAGVITTYPATYSDKQLALLRQALALSGAGDILLVPEPVAAAEWLEYAHGPLESNFVLVYDLGGTSLDVTVVRVGPDWDNHPMIGKPMRSYDFGGRPLGAMIARYAPDPARRSMTPIVDIDGLRTVHVQDSLEVVRACVRASGVTMSDIGRILVIGGASRPAEVARTLAELGRPVVISADPGQIVAAGAALMAARTAALGTSGGRTAVPRAAVISSAAVVSAVAMSAVTVFGGPTVPGLSPLSKRFPDISAPTEALLFDARGEQVAEAWSRVTAAARWHAGYVMPSFLSPRASLYSRLIPPAPRGATYGPSVSDSRFGSHREPRNCCSSVGPRDGRYTNPAVFVNPLPFVFDRHRPPSGHGWPHVPTQPHVPDQPPASGADTPAGPPAGSPAPPGTTVPAPQTGWPPAIPNPATPPASGATAPGHSTDAPSTGAGADTPGSGVPSDSEGGSSGDTSSEGASAGGNPADASNGGTPSWNDGSTSGTTHGTSSTGDSSSSVGSAGGSTGGPSSAGSTEGASTGGSSPGGSRSGGGSGGVSSGGSTGRPSRAGATGGATTGGSSPGGSRSGGSHGGPPSSGGASAGNSSGASPSGGSVGRSSPGGGSTSGGSAFGGMGGGGMGGGRGR